MLSLQLNEFMLELKDGAFKNVGPANKRADVKLYDVEAATAREFGDERVKLVFEDEDGNEVHVALFPGQVEALAADVDELRGESRLFE